MDVNMDVGDLPMACHPVCELMELKHLGADIVLIIFLWASSPRTAPCTGLLDYGLNCTGLLHCGLNCTGLLYCVPQWAFLLSCMFVCTDAVGLYQDPGESPSNDHKERMTLLMQIHTTDLQASIWSSHCDVSCTTKAQRGSGIYWNIIGHWASALFYCDSTSLIALLITWFLLCVHINTV